MILVFDLDDTLYPEITFVESGFRAVSQYLSKEYKLDKDLLYHQFIKTLEKNGRGKVLDDVLAIYQLKSKQLIKKCLSIYRLHKPNIKLPRETIEILNYYKNTPKYIVTDGNKIVQANKIKALGLDKYIKKAFITHRYGIQHAKPSPYCFLKICHLEKAQPTEVVYIGDNPNKDFVGIKPLGFRTIRILMGPYKNQKEIQSLDADFEIFSLLEIKNRF